MESETGKQQQADTDSKTCGAGPGVLEAARREKRAYAGSEERPLGAFVLIMMAYAAVFGALTAAVRRSGCALPQRQSLPDVALAAVATHKLSRLIAKDPVTSPLRAPFASYAGQSGEAELAEEVRGTGLRKAVGELVTCPFCVGQWVATGFLFGLVLAPGPTRFLASIFTALTGSDLLQLAYAKLQQAATKPSS